MEKHKQASEDQAALYRHEATVRIAALSAVTIVSVAAGLLVASIILLFFPHTGGDTRDRIFTYSFIAVFAIVCGGGVYQVDKVLNRKFNQNP